MHYKNPFDFFLGDPFDPTRAKNSKPKSDSTTSYGEKMQKQVLENMWNKWKPSQKSVGIGGKI